MGEEECDCLSSESRFRHRTWEKRNVIDALLSHREDFGSRLSLRRSKTSKCLCSSVLSYSVASWVMTNVPEGATASIFMVEVKMFMFH
jgi:hypothetical protein